MGNPFVHVELNTTDVAKARGFYEKLFDWRMKDAPSPAGTYTLIEVGQGTGGGLMQHRVPGVPSAWVAYVQVEDVRASTQTAKGLGAAIAREVTEVPGFGWFSIIVDPTGAPLGLWKPKSS